MHHARVELWVSRHSQLQVLSLLQGKCYTDSIMQHNKRR